MKKARLIAGMTAAIPAAVGGFAAPAAAHAAQATATLAHQAPAKGKTVMRHDVQAATTGGPGWYSQLRGDPVLPEWRFTFPPRWLVGLRNLLLQRQYRES